MSALSVLPNAACGGQRPSVNIIAPSDTPGNEAAKVGRIIAELNELIPQKPLRGLEAVNLSCEAPSYTPDHRIKYSLPYGLDSVVHEMGHAIYDALLSEKSDEFSFKVKDELWKDLYFLSLGFGNYEIVKDSNYIDKINCGGVDLTERAGHPWENPSELFASSLMVYRMHADRFIAKIIDPAVSRETREFGKLIFLYMRDRIFKGKVFSNDDPFKRETLNNYGPGLVENNGFAALVEAIGEKGPVQSALASRSNQLKVNAIISVFSSRVRDRRFLDAINGILNQEDDLAKSLAYDLIGHSASSVHPMPYEFAITILVKALNDEKDAVKLHAARAVEALGLKDKRLVEPFRKTLSDPDLALESIAIKYLSENGDQKDIPALEELPKYPVHIGNEARKAIEKIKEREKNQ